jgi:hypothetical protein
MWQRSTCFFGVLLVLLSGCVDKFEPNVISAPERYLVVDGFINLNGVTTIRLSRTQSLTATAAPPPETQATAAIRDEAGTAYALTEQQPGVYTSTALTLPAAHRYQLSLRTAAGREYLSDLVEGRQTPAIDSVTWDVEARGVQIYVNSHDASNNTRYYRWDYTETWEFHSAYNSSLEYVNGAMQLRTENIYNCWGTANSTDIKLSSTVRLSQDVVSRFPLTLLPANSMKLGHRYSILVRQYAQTAEEHAYWELLQKNTENIGTLFDPLPSQLTGNVHSLSDVDEPVIGYVGAATAVEQRLFIVSTQLPRTRFATGYETCSAPDTILMKDVATHFSNPALLPVYPIYFPMSNMLLGYAGSSASCLDCRLRGTNQKPSFWP